MQFDDWLSSGYSTVLPADDRAALAWRRINDRPTSIVVSRGFGASRSQLTAQTVRLEWNNRAERTDQTLTTTGKITVTVFGIRDHATLPDTDIRRSDRFSIAGTTYEVMALIEPPGEIQAVCQESGAS